MLYIVATPIGNLKDITLRALEVLKGVDLIACEDTRRSAKLLKAYGITTPTTSYYEYNKFKRGDYLLDLLKEGKDVALISDSGTPGISDPGAHLIKLCINNDIPLTAVPGPTGLVAALALSGLAANKFVFEGFLPTKPGARKRRLQELASLKRTVVLYESPHRLTRLLEEILLVLGDNHICVARELTKKFEEVKRGKVSEILDEFRNKPPRGEFVVMF
jgi:16S rRNA (cytidine1402-2'-O)-methyltransferase